MTIICLVNFKALLSKQKHVSKKITRRTTGVKRNNFNTRVFEIYFNLRTNHCVISRIGIDELFD